MGSELVLVYIVLIVLSLLRGPHQRQRFFVIAFGPQLIFWVCVLVLVFFFWFFSFSALLFVLFPERFHQKEKGMKFLGTKTSMVYKPGEVAVAHGTVRY